MTWLLTVGLVILILALVVIFSDDLLRMTRPKEPEVSRKWTDPSERERLD